MSEIILNNKNGIITVTPPHTEPLDWFSVKVLEDNIVKINLSGFKEREAKLVEALKQIIKDNTDPIYKKIHGSGETANSTLKELGLTSEYQGRKVLDE